LSGILLVENQKIQDDDTWQLLASGITAPMVDPFLDGRDDGRLYLICLRTLVYGIDG
jgi:hypothetical protein